MVWGGKDRYLAAEFGRAYAEALGNAELLELPEAGHWPWRDDPAVIPRIANFSSRASRHFRHHVVKNR